jgi:hypothetical protein
MLIVIALGALAWIAPAASAQVPVVPDPVGAVGGGVGGGTVPGTGSGGGVVVPPIVTPPGTVTDPGSDPVGDVVDTVNNGSGGGGSGGGVVDKVTDTVNGTVHNADQASGGSVGGAKETIDKAAGGVTEGSPAENPLGGFGHGGHKGSLDGPNAGSGSAHNGSASSAAGSNGTLGSHTFKSTQLHGLDPKNRTHPLADRTLVASATTTSASEHTPILTQLAQAAIEAAGRVAFPLALGLMVVAFLMVQGRIDRKDAKLVLAPIDAEQELLSFQ